MGFFFDQSCEYSTMKVVVLLVYHCGNARIMLLWHTGVWDLQILTAKGANIHIQQEHRFTALMLAAQYGHLKIVQVTFNSNSYLGTDSSVYFSDFS